MPETTNGPAGPQEHESDTRELAALASPQTHRARRLTALATTCAVLSSVVAVLLAVRLLRPPAPAGPKSLEVVNKRQRRAEPPPALPPPAPVDSVLVDGGATEVRVTFGVPVEPALAEATASYAMDPPVDILSATLADDGRTVTLTTAALEEDTTYHLTTRGVRATRRPGSPVAFRYESAPRATDGLLALYDFEEGEGAVVKDVSGVGEPLHLTAADADGLAWVPGGLAVRRPTLIASEGPAAKLMEGSRSTNAITIEAWIQPGNATQGGPSRIVTLSKNPLQRNFTLGQEGPGYDVRLRTTATGENGASPSFRVPSGVASRLSHVVYTRNGEGVAALYINGSLAADGPIRGDLSNWAEDMGFALANELTADRPWLGEFYLVAIYDRALSAEEVGRNYKAGPGGRTPRP